MDFIIIKDVRLAFGKIISYRPKDILIKKFRSKQINFVIEFETLKEKPIIIEFEDKKERDIYLSKLDGVFLSFFKKNNLIKE